MFIRLESLRGLAACLVVIYHSPFRFDDTSIGLVRHSYLFVDLFFVLSGFVMAYAYGDKILQGMKFSHYVVLRLGRLYPLHLFTLLLWVPYVLLKQYLYMTGFGGTDQLEENNLATFASNLLLVHAMGVHDTLSWNHPSWSISTEFFAYLVFFLLAVSLDGRRTVWFPWLVVIGCYGWLLSLGITRLDVTYDYGFIRCLGAFYLGVFVFRLRDRVVIWHQRGGAPVWRVSGAEWLAVALVAATVSLAGQGIHWAFGAVASFGLLILVFSARGGGYLARLLDTPLLRRIGLWSFSIYMIHRLLQFGVSNVFEFVLGIDPKAPMGWLSVLLNLVMLVLVIWLSKYSYEWVEKRCREWVKRRIQTPGPAPKPRERLADDT